MGDVTVAELESLLDAYRALLSGRAASSSSPVLRSVAGYVADSVGNQLPLGSIRQSLKSMIEQVELSAIHRDVIKLYYGIDLTLLPATGKLSIASSLPAIVGSSSGRPRERLPGRLGPSAARIARTSALNVLAASWTPNPRAQAFLCTAEPEPMESEWFTEAVSAKSTADTQVLIATALMRARISASKVPQKAAELWLDLDWWAYRNGLESGVWAVAQAPSPRVNQQRLARGTAHMSIALWDCLLPPGTRADPWLTQRSPGTTRTSPSAPLLLIPPPELEQALVLQEPADLARELILSLDATSKRGACDYNVAELLAPLEDAAFDSLPSDLVALGASVLARASADHPVRAVLGVTWFERLYVQHEFRPFLAPAALNMSVALAVRGRYTSALWYLTRAYFPDGGDSAYLAIGRAALTVRRLKAALPRYWADDRLVALSKRAIIEGRQAHEMATLEPGLGDTPFRGAIRLAEALSVSAGLLRERGSRFDRLAAEAADLAIEVEGAAVDTSSDNYAAVRRLLIGTSAASLDKGEPLVVFRILDRVVERENQIADPLNQIVSGDPRRASERPNVSE